MATQDGVPPRHTYRLTPDGLELAGLQWHALRVGWFNSLLWAGERVRLMQEILRQAAGTAPGLRDPHRPASIPRVGPSHARRSADFVEGHWAALAWAFGGASVMAERALISPT